MDGKQLQVQETKEMLKQGLLTLLQSQDFSEISVTDIIEVSQTSRRTFYRHFRNKRALLDYYLQELMKEYFRVEEDMQSKPNQYEAYLYLFRFWYSKRQELRGLVKSQLFPPLFLHGMPILQQCFSLFLRSRWICSFLGYTFSSEATVMLFGTGCKRRSRRGQKSLQTIFSRL